MNRTESQNRQIEEWRDIPGFEGRYQASTLGRIKSLSRKVNSMHGPATKTIRERILKTNGDPYLLVCLGGDAVRLVHRSVAQAWIPNPENLPCVNHKDGNKLNNTVENLEWVTYSQNERHSYDVLGKKPNSGTFQKGLIPHNITPVIRYALTGEVIGVYPSATAAAKAIGSSQSRVSTNARGETKTCFKSIFKYTTVDKYSALLDKANIPISTQSTD